MNVAVIIPVLNEVDTIGAVVRAVPSAVPRVLVVDAGSTDGTVEAAEAAGAQVIVERTRGYGRACMAGVAAAAQQGADVVAFVDGALAEDPAELAAVIAPITSGAADFVVGSRVTGQVEPGALRPLQRLGNAVATALIGLRHGHRYSDLGSMRAIRLRALLSLRLQEPAHGWPTELQIRAIQHGLRVCEVPISYRRRRHGRSKVAGSVTGSLRASAAILRVIAGWAP